MSDITHLQEDIKEIKADVKEILNTQIENGKQIIKHQQSIKWHGWLIKGVYLAIFGIAVWVIREGML